MRYLKNELQPVTPKTSFSADKKSKRFVIEDPIYNFSYCVAAGGSPKEAVDAFQLPDADTDNLNGTTAGVTFAKEGHNSLVMWYPSKKVHFITVSHECTHAILFMFSERGVANPSFGNDEHFTYLHDWLVTELCKRLDIETGV